MATGPDQLLLVTGGDDTAIHITSLRMRQSAAGLACEMLGALSMPSAHTSAVKVRFLSHNAFYFKSALCCAMVWPLTF